jgi:hypothetical protein
MIHPVIHYRKQYFSKKSSYPLFTEVESLNLKDDGSADNDYNLISSLEHTDALIIKFRNQGFTNP